MRTRIGIIGAGPAGLFLAHLLHRAGIESVIVETRSRAAVESTIRAGMLEDWVVRLLRAMGLADRLDREAHFHDGVSLQVGAVRQHLDLAGLTGGKQVTIYAQHEVLKDLIAARLADGGEIRFEAHVTALDGIEGDSPAIHFTEAGDARRLDCDFIVAADGFHGPGRDAIPDAARREYQKVYPFGWLGILCHAPRSWPELVYARHEDGFALLTTRSDAIQRLYIQCEPADPIEAWPDARIWDALHRRLATPGWSLTEGAIFQKGIIPLRSFVCETMRHGRLFLAGDAAHIVPPTGAKGLNLAVADVRVLARAFERFYAYDDAAGFDTYAATALGRIWKGERFSWWMTTMLHRDPSETDFEHRIHAADLAYVMGSTAAQAALAENYLGLPFTD
ncbi:4-hydroxybenzoate 3-monooxygenase [Plastoroseomonas arctica]|uniref:4-hydroxybenzoate 3-monooxygenase n=1 Tax=Plastoroseomonas arctica TaxID=1509237 RepID=A0AAF1KUA1_9PROT|nr:4-hydroxybenzoate 3-monooxygenase [Plastoroseomonas arctica]